MGGRRTGNVPVLRALAALTQNTSRMERGRGDILRSRTASAEVPIALEGRTLHTVSLFGQDGDMEVLGVLGAYTLEAFGLAVSPVLRRFIPF
jgi:hypothetical protein